MKSEIRIANVHLETKLVLSEEHVQLLIIESPNEFYSMVSELNSQLDGGEGRFVFSREGEIISPSKYGVMISDIFHFELTDKKITNLLYKKLENISINEKAQFYHELCTKSIAFLEELSFCVPFSIEYDEPQPTDIFKISGLKLSAEYENLEERIICYMNALIELKNCEFFVFVNLKSVLDDEKLEKVYRHCQSEQVGLLLVESAKRRPLLPFEKAVIITEDLCEILENYEEEC